MRRRRLSVAEVRRRAERVTNRLARLPLLVRLIIELLRADVGHRFTLADLSTIVNRSPSHLNAMFHRSTGLTVHQYAVFLRMTEAAHSIAQGDKIEAVAILVGYRSKKSFYRQFKAWFGVNPAALRCVNRSRTDVRRGDV